MVRLLTILCAVAALAALGSAGAEADDLPLGFTVHVVIAGSGQGSVTVASTGFTHTYSSPQCGQSGNGCIVTQYNGLPIVFSANPAAGSVFSGWAGTDCAGLKDVCTAMGNGQMWAKFERKPGPDIPIVKPLVHQLSLGTDGSGSGTITGDALPAGAAISCHTTCSQTLAHGTLVALHAVPSTGSAFAGWSGSCTGTSTTCMVSMDTSRSVTGRFTANAVGLFSTLSVTVVGLGTLSGQGIDCPAACSKSYANGTAVTLTAQAKPGFVLGGWSGACSGTASTCAVVMAGTKTVTATFVPASTPSSGGAAPSAPAPSAPAPASAPASSPGSSPATPASRPVDPNACTIIGTPGPDVIVGTRHRDVICGLGGNDTLIGKAGNDLLRGGAGRDVLRGGLGADRLLGGSGIDLLLAHDGVKDRLAGGTGVDRARVDRGRDVLAGVESYS